MRDELMEEKLSKTQISYESELKNLSLENNKKSVYQGK